MRAGFQSDASRFHRIGVGAHETLTIMAIFRGSRFQDSVAADANAAFDAVAELIRRRPTPN